jgi:hypothetical protein
MVHNCFSCEAVVLVWNEVVIWNSQINNWMQLASVLEPPVNIIYKDATRIYVTIQNTCLNLEEEFLNLKLPIGLQETILIYIAAE